MAESSNCLGDSTGGVEVAGVAGAGGGETSDGGDEKSLGEEVGKAWEGCMLTRRHCRCRARR